MLHGRGCIRRACHCASPASSLARRAESAPSLGALLSVAPAALGVISPIQELQQLEVGVLPHEPLDGPRWVAVCHGGLQSASSFFLRAWFAFRFQLE